MMFKSWILLLYCIFNVYGCGLNQCCAKCSNAFAGVVDEKPDFSDEMQELMLLKKKTLQTIIGVANGFLDSFTERLEVYSQIGKLVKKEGENGFAAHRPPYNEPGYHSKDARTQLELRQKYERQLLEQKTDNQFKSELIEKSHSLKKGAGAMTEMMSELKPYYADLTLFLNEMQK